MDEIDNMKKLLEEAKPLVDAALAAAKEMAPGLADVYRAYYVEFVRVGFTEEQAMKLCCQIQPAPK